MNGDRVIDISVSVIRWAAPTLLILAAANILITAFSELSLTMTQLAIECWASIGSAILAALMIMLVSLRES